MNTVETEPECYEHNWEERGLFSCPVKNQILDLRGQVSIRKYVAHAEENERRVAVPEGSRTGKCDERHTGRETANYARPASGVLTLNGKRIEVCYRK